MILNVELTMEELEEIKDCIQWVAEWYMKNETDDCCGTVYNLQKLHKKLEDRTSY